MLRDPGSIQEAYNMPPQQQPKFRRPSAILEQSTPPVYPPKERPSLLSLRQVAADAPRTPPSNASEDYPQVFDPASVNIYSAVYSGVAVLEMMSRGIAVMRRRADSYLNATQILKVAGIDKGKRTKILEREILQGHHEKVQGGYGKYQGTWVPFQRGRELAEQYGVEHYLRPLFMYDISLADGRFDKTPTKEQAMAAQKKEAAARGDSPAQPASRKRHKANSVSQHNANSSQNSCGTVSSQHSIQVLPGPPVPEPQAAERNRAILMAIFLNEDPNQVPDLLADPNFPTDIDIDLIIDDQGMTALHWSATLARINISRLLVDRGANVCRFNYASETPLIRSVLVTNNYDNQTFFDLLGLLHPSLAAVDYRMRSVLHHIALTAGILGREHAARYYMECILEWIARNGGNFSRLIDLQDKNGDTALNLAARVGDPSLVRQLLDVGANQFLINRAGLKLSDFGMTIHDQSFSLPDAQYRSGMDQAQVAADAASVQAYINNDSDVVEQKSIPSSPESKVKFEASTAPRTGKRARELVDNDQSVEQIVDDLEGDYETELVRVKEELTETRQTLRSTTCELATLRRQLFALRSQYDQLEMATQKITNCEMAIQTESKYNGSLPMTAPHSPCRDQYHGGSHDRRSSHIPTTPPASIKGDGNPGRDGSCLVSANVSDDESSESAVRSLRVRTGRYARSDVDVKPEIDQLKRNAAIRELQCKQLISSCCNLPIATVDGLLATLSKAVNSDGSKVDMDRVKSLISMVTREEGLGAHVVSTGAREH